MFGELVGRIAGRFSRVEPRHHAEKLLLGLVSELPRKSCWTIAEHVGEASPDGLQHLLARAVWDADEVRDDLRDYVVDHLGDHHAVLIVDETGDLKKGTHTVGVQRQYAGTAGRVENSQVAVYPTCATISGRAFLDRELYLPKSWTSDPDRCAAAGVSENIRFATKPALATTMITRALDAGINAPWVTGVEVDGADLDSARNWRTAESGTYWPSDVTAVSAPRPVCSARRSWSHGYRGTCGSGSRSARVRKAGDSMTGHWSASTPMPRSRGIDGC